MSAESVEVISRIYRASEPWLLFELLDEGVEVDYSTHPLPDFPVSIHGKEAAVDWWRHYWGTWDEYTVEVTEIIDAGEERVVVVQRERGRGKGSGVPFELHAAVVWHLRGSNVTKVHFFGSREDALEAVGLSEQDAHADS